MSIAAAAVPAAEEPAVNRAMITVAVMLATIMQAVDTTIANVALPSMQGAMSATQEQISWVLTSYIVAAAIMTPPTGVLAARFGRKRLFTWAVVGFTIASMMCGAAQSLTEIVAFRFLQGVFGAALVPLSQSVLLDTFPREKHGSAMAIWGVGVMVGPIVGPTLGGYLTDFYSWRWVFYINLPVGILALLGILAFVPETKLDKARGFDFFGFALLSIAITSLQLTLDRGSSLDWFSSNEIIFEAVLAGLGLYMFLVHMFTAKRPFIEPALFKDRNFSAGMAFMFFLSVVLLASMALLPPFMQTLMGYPVIATGVVLAPRGLGTMITMFFAGRLMTKIQPRLMIICGLLLIAWSLWVMAGFTAEVSESTIMWTGFVQGLGFGLCFVPLTTVTFATLAPHYRTDGTGMFSLVRNVGTSMGVSIVTSLLAANIQEIHASLAERLTPFRDSLAPSLMPRLWNWTTTQGAAAFDMVVTREAMTIAYLNDFLFMMVVTLAALPLAFILKMPPKAVAPAEPIIVE